MEGYFFGNVFFGIFFFWLLAFGFWLLAFGFWLLAPLVSGFWLVFAAFWSQNLWFACYLLQFGANLHAHLAFGFWLWLHLTLGFWFLLFFLALVSLGFWLLAALLLNVCGVDFSLHITFHNFIEYTAYKLHVNCTETRVVIWAYMHAVVRGIETCFQQVSQLLAVPEVLKTLFQDTCWTVVLQLYLLELCFTMVAWQSEVSLCTFEFICMLIGEKLQPFSIHQVS